jgi:quinoprotein glucose dehydrogenase
MDYSFRFTMRSTIVGLASTATPVAYAQKDWPTFGHDLAGTLSSALEQIYAKNVTKLARVWTYPMDAGAQAQAGAALAPGSSEAVDAMAGASPAGRGRGRGGRGGPNGADENLEPESGNEISANAVTDGAPASRGPEFSAGDRQSPATIFFGASSGRGR